MSLLVGVFETRCRYRRVHELAVSQERRLCRPIQPVQMYLSAIPAAREILRRLPM